MKRLVTSVGTLIALMAMAPAAEAGSYSFSIGGHRFHVEAPRNCRSASCVSVSSRSLRPTEDLGTAPQRPPAPVVQAPQAVCPEAPVRPPQATAVVPQPMPPILAATTSQPVAPPPKLETATAETLSPIPPRVDLPRAGPPTNVPLDRSRVEPPVVAPKQGMPIAQLSGDQPAYTPVGEWESNGANGTVRIERCGPALCGYVQTEASNRGESVLVNMKPRSHDVWAGSLYSRFSGNTYRATMTLKSSGKLHVEACALGRFFCSGNDWTRVEEQPGQVITTSRQWSPRS